MREGGNKFPVLNGGVDRDLKLAQISTVVYGRLMVVHECLPRLV